jgi:L-iditol 2-dehydrogenase
MIGIFIIKLLIISGASTVIAIDIDEKHLRKSEKAGADFIFQNTEKGLPEKVRVNTAGRGADIAFEAVGKSESVNLAIEIVRRGGTVILVGNTAPKMDFPLQKVVTGELKIHGSCAICGEYETILDYIKTGKLNVNDQISAVAPLSEGAQWFERLYRREEDLGKVILIP